MYIHYLLHFWMHILRSFMTSISLACFVSLYSFILHFTCYIHYFYFILLSIFFFMTFSYDLACFVFLSFFIWLITFHIIYFILLSAFCLLLWPTWLGLLHITAYPFFIYFTVLLPINIYYFISYYYPHFPDFCDLAWLISYNFISFL